MRVSGESLSPLSLTKLDEIRAQTSGVDWSAQLVEGAMIDDLDPEAVERARSNFAFKHQNRIAPEKVRGWRVEALLDRAKVTTTRAGNTCSVVVIGSTGECLFAVPASSANDMETGWSGNRI